MSQQATAPRGLLTFSIVWFGQLISSLGSGLTGFGLSVWLFQTTGSVVQFALNSLFYVLPLGMIQLVAGALVDRWDRRRILILVDTGQALATLVVALLLFADRLAVWHIYGLTIISAALRSFQGPAYDASVVLLVPKRHLGRAAGMAQVSRAVTDLVTPALAGVLIVSIRLQGVVLIDLATFLVAIVTLLIVRIPSPKVTPAAEDAVRGFGKEIIYGWRYIVDRPGLLGLNIVSYVHDFFVNAALVLIVPMVLSIASADGAGAVLASGGAGLLIGSLLMSAWGGPERRVSLFLGAVAFNGVALIVAGWSPHVVLIAAGNFLFFLGFSVMAVCLRPILQRKVPPSVQGRVFGAIGALAMLTEAPAYPVGGILADQVFGPLMTESGTLAGVLGPVIGVGPGRGMGLLMIVLGVCVMLTALIGALSPRVRQLEDELPDAITETTAGEDTLATEAGSAMM
jgi:MFS transporter, DHA3 family, macrolide efflux protein